MNRTAKDVAVSDSVPSIIWMVAASKISKDADTGAPTAFLIIEELDLPKEIFEIAKTKFVTTDRPFELAFVVDWRWPNEIESREPVNFELVWVTPSGERFGAKASDTAIVRPSVQNRARIHAQIEGVPVKEEGIYFFEVLLNDVSKYRYPIRLRSLQETGMEAGAAKAKPPVARRRKTSKKN